MVSKFLTDFFRGRCTIKPVLKWYNSIFYNIFVRTAIFIYVYIYCFVCVFQPSPKNSSLFLKWISKVFYVSMFKKDLRRSVWCSCFNRWKGKPFFLRGEGGCIGWPKHRPQMLLRLGNHDEVNRGWYQGRWLLLFLLTSLKEDQETYWRLFQKIVIQLCKHVTPNLK